MKKYFSLALFLVVAVIFLSGCAGNLITPGTENGSTSPTQADGVGAEKGTLKIYLTDAPGDYLEVNIKISKIEAHIAVDGEEGEEESWVKLKEWEEGLLVDLIELEDVSILLASLELEANKYTQLRLFLMGGEEDAWIVLEGEEGSEGPKSTETLEIPSVYLTGIKLNRPFEIVAGMITKLTIDFDAKKSVVKTGNGKYKLKPVIHVTSETYSEGEELPEGAGSVSGTVSYYDSQNPELVGIVGASVSLSGGEYIFNNTTTTSEEPGSEGTFILDNVPADSYTLNVNANGFDEYSEGIEVTDGANTEVNVILLFEETGAISGSVVDFDSGEPIESVTVIVTLSGGVYTFNSSADTNESGEFVIEQLPVGVYDLTVLTTDYDEYIAGGIGVTEGAINDIGEIKLMPSTSSP